MNITDLVDLALKEDIGPGDHTTLSCIEPGLIKKAELIVKDEGIIAGIELAEMICKQFDAELNFIPKLKDGDQVKNGDRAFYLEGKAQSLLQIERLVLNYMQRMSGIATLTKKYTDALEGLSCKLLDTRKTTPGFRYFEKWAVRIGGAYNHRYALYDMIMIKDNHVDYAGGIIKAIDKVNQYLKDQSLNLKREIEVRNFNELDVVLAHGGIDRIMLDNFTVTDLKKAVTLINKQYETEASGGITLETIRAYAETGVDFISSGALTHSYKSMDLSLKAIEG
ncbi:MAG TPA: carboxylating nicotinate-nucleotide diphosphorylase [Bacteroidia bacterium]|nr:carboxylating nicotinate-nucleotide diphosphorylase [Bacteroidia bacterium]HNT80077.1 carboxylating nicotinate-nucleotide diphosphorylase [Bacteroidia bacterium]